MLNWSLSSRRSRSDHNLRVRRKKDGGRRVRYLVTEECRGIVVHTYIRTCM